MNCSIIINRVDKFYRNVIMYYINRKIRKFAGIAGIIKSHAHTEITG